MCCVSGDRDQSVDAVHVAGGWWCVSGDRDQSVDAIHVAGSWCCVLCFGWQRSVSWCYSCSRQVMLLCVVFQVTRDQSVDAVHVAGSWCYCVLCFRWQISESVDAVHVAGSWCCCVLFRVTEISQLMLFMLQAVGVTVCCVSGDRYQSLLMLFM